MFHKKQKVILVTGFLLSLWLVAVIGLVRFAENSNKNKDKSGITAIVTSIASRPNIAENGYYGISLKDSHGQTYTIDATGYLNTPLTPESRGETCVNVPDVKVGDTLLFKLPKSEVQPNTYDICYKQGSGNYFIKRV